MMSVELEAKLERIEELKRQVEEGERAREELYGMLGFKRLKIAGERPKLKVRNPITIKKIYSPKPCCGSKGPRHMADCAGQSSPVAEPEAEPNQQPKHSKDAGHGYFKRPKSKEPEEMTHSVLCIDCDKYHEIPITAETMTTPCPKCGGKLVE